MARRSTQQLIEDVRLLTRVLEKAGVSLDDIKAKIKSVSETSLNVRQFGTGQATSTGIQRAQSQIEAAIFQNKNIGKTLNLGPQSRFSSGGAFVDIKKDLEQTLGNIFNPNYFTEISKLRTRLSELKKDWVSLGKSPDDFNKAVKRLTGSSVNDIKVLENAVAKLEARLQRVKTIQQQIPSVAPSPQPATPVNGRTRYWNTRKAGEQIDQILTDRAARTALGQNDTINDQLSDIAKLRKAYDLMGADLQAFDAKIKQAMNTNDVKILKQAIDDLVLSFSKLQYVQKPKVQAPTQPVTGAAQAVSPTGGTQSRPPSFQQLVADADKLRQTLISLGVPLANFDQRLTAAVATGDVKVLDAELKKLTQDFLNVATAAGKAGQAVGGVTGAAGAAGAAGGFPNPTTPPRTQGAPVSQMNQTAAGAINQDALQRFIDKSAGIIPAGSTALISKEIDKTIQSLTAGGKAVDDFNIKTKTLSNGVERVTVSFQNQGKEIKKQELLIKNVAGAYDILSNAQEKISKQQLANLQGQNRYSPAFAKAREFGFQPEDLNKVRTEPTTKMDTLNFRKVDEITGAMREANLVITKTGEILVDTQKRFRSFGDAIVRDTVEVLKWSLAVGVVYGTMQKLQEAIQTAIQNQSKLVDINIALGRSQGNLNDIFENASRIAQQTGEALDGVLDGYVQAYRAAGDARTEIERTATANKFLTDSLVLSKLSSLDQAESLDILSGALKQLQQDGETTDQMFAKSADLLDKWVVTTRNANVDLATLATAFSVTSESADNAGLSMEELNGVIAVLSEKLGALSPKEAGNTVRALIGGIYSESAAKALAGYGVAVTDATGKSRDFLDIMKQIYDLNQAGLISDDQLNKLALTLGGGVRRGQQYLAFLTSIGKVYDLVGKQSNSTGAAQDALGQKLNTVETSVTNLGNAFMELAQSMGGEGGVLTLMKDVLTIATSLVEMLNGITKAAGTAGPAIIAALAGAAYFSGENRGPRLQGLMGMLSRFGAKYEMQPPAPGTEGPANKVLTGSVGKSAYNFLSGGTFGGNVTTGVLGGALPALTNLQQGDPKAAVANIAGGIVGSLVSAGNPIGAVIGAAIAGSFTKAVETWFDTSDDSAENFFSGALGRAIDTAKNPPKEPTDAMQTFKSELDKRAEELQQELYKTAAGYRGAGSARFASGLTSELLNLSSQVISPIKSLFSGKQETPVEYTQEDISAAFAYMGGDKDKVLAIIKELQEIKDLQRKALEGGATTATGLQREEDIKDRNVEFFKTYTKEVSDRLLQQVITGEITAKSSETQKGRLPEVMSSATQLQATVGTQFQGALGIATEEQSLKRLMDLLLTAPDDATQQLAALNGEINTLAAEIEKAAGGTVEWGDKELTTAQATELQTQKANELTAALKGLNTQYQQSQIKVPQVLDFTDVTKKEAEELVTKSKADMRTELKTVLPEVSDSDLETYISSFEPVWLKLKDGYMQVFEIDPKYLEDAKKYFEEIGKIASKSLDFSFFEADKFNIARQYYQGTKEKLQEKGYVPNEEAQIVMLDDGSIENLTYDNKIMSLLMSQLVDISRKQLDGIYNLPTEASFYIPAQAAAYFPGPSGGGYSDENIKKWGVEAGGDIATTSQAIDTVLTGQAARIARLEEEQGLADENAASRAAQSTTQVPVTTTPRPEGDLSWIDEYDMVRARERNLRTVDEATRAMEEFKSSNAPTNPYATPYNNPFINSDVYNYQPPGTQVPTVDQNLGETGMLKNMIDSLGALAKQNLNFKLTLSSNTNLLLDGRIVANAVKRYLSEDLLTAAQNSYAKNNVL